LSPPHLLRIFIFGTPRVSSFSRYHSSFPSDSRRCVHSRILTGPPLCSFFSRHTSFTSMLLLKIRRSHENCTRIPGSSEKGRFSPPPKPTTGPLLPRTLSFASLPPSDYSITSPLRIPRHFRSTAISHFFFPHSLFLGLQKAAPFDRPPPPTLGLFS